MSCRQTQIKLQKFQAPTVDNMEIANEKAA